MEPSRSRLFAMPRHLTLHFDPGLPPSGKPLRDGLSVVSLRHRTVWVANDETLALERLTLNASGDRAAGHVSFALADCLDLPLPPMPDSQEEADIEGLDWDEDDTLWLVGSHSLKRRQPRPEDSPEQAAKRLADLGRDGNRYLLARLPLVQEADGWRPVTKDGKRRAAVLKGDACGNDLTRALKKDEHLGDFLAIPGKDNGFDIEGLARADGRLFLGLRGPVLRGWAVILELEPRGRKRLRLEPLEGERPYLKHFLHLGGLGVRDLCRQGDDLLILAGPTMDLDGPVRVLRWRGGAQRHEGGQRLPQDQLEVVMEIPYGRGNDHAEGITLLDDKGKATLLVVYDSAATTRQRGKSSVLADLFPLPEG